MQQDTSTAFNQKGTTLSTAHHNRMTGRGAEKADLSHPSTSRRQGPATKPAASMQKARSQTGRGPLKPSPSGHAIRSRTQSTMLSNRQGQGLVDQEKRGTWRHRIWAPGEDSSSLGQQRCNERAACKVERGPRA